MDGKAQLESSATDLSHMRGISARVTVSAASRFGLGGLALVPQSLFTAATSISSATMPLLH